MVVAADSRQRPDMVRAAGSSLLLTIFSRSRYTRLVGLAMKLVLKLTASPGREPEGRLLFTEQILRMGYIP